MGWIKIETHLCRKSEIIRIAQTLGISRNEAVGLCIEFWSWADSETTDGLLSGCAFEIIDNAVGHGGFAAGLLSVGWLEERDEGLNIPNFDRHNGKSAKKRMNDAIRQQKRRGREEAE